MFSHQRITRRVRARRGAGPIDDAGMWIRTQYGKLPDPLQKALPAIGAASAAALAAYLGHKGYAHYRREPLEVGWHEVASPQPRPRFRIVRKGAFMPDIPNPYRKKLM